MLLGNEAVARGAAEAGVDIATTYPGTPSSEIGTTFGHIGKELGIYFEYSTNEKVALEVAAGASIAGMRSLAFMKHVGLNVAADAFVTLITMGVRGGMIILSADDPAAHSSQNEQDNRFYALLANVPMLEPATPQEAKEMVRIGFDLSEELEIPFLLRTTTRLNHVRGPVELKELGPRREPKEFERDPFRFVTVPLVARLRHPWLLETEKKAREMSESSEFNFFQDFEGDAPDGKKVLIITSGVSYNYVVDVLPEMGIAAKVLKIGMTHPLPERMIGDALAETDTAIIVEELEPYMEVQVRDIAQRRGLTLEIHGKAQELFPRILEFNPDVVKQGIVDALELKLALTKSYPSEVKAPSRPPNLCPGCPHRASFYAAKTACNDSAVYAMDIGCYTLGLLPPLRVADTEVCMGSSVGVAGGLSKATGQKVISFIGDSTFFHSGIPALINALHNKHDFVLAILDNRTTAMTGHQSHPGIPLDGMGDPAPSLDIADLVRGLGIDFVEVVDPYELEPTTDTFKRAFEHEGIAVVIARQTCALLLDKAARKTPEGIIPYFIDQDECRKCRMCVGKFGCIALYVEGEDIMINQQLCDGCGVCSQVCPFGAIKRTCGCPDGPCGVHYDEPSGEDECTEPLCEVAEGKEVAE